MVEGACNRCTTVIEAVEGLGEELVSGRKTPETYRIRSGKIFGDRTFLTDEQVKRLAGIGETIEAEYGIPQDIEWCLENDEFFIVQSRPITTLFPLPEKTDDKNHIYMSFSHQQMMTDAIKPLGMYLFLTLGTDKKLKILSVGGRMYGDLSADLASPIGRKIVLTTFGQSDPLSVGAIKNLLGRKEFMSNIARGGSKFFSLDAGYFSPEFFRQMLIVTCKNDAGLVPALIEKIEKGNQKFERQLEGLSGEKLFQFIANYQKQLRKDLYEPVGMAAVMATESSTAAPKVILSPDITTSESPPKITLHKRRVSTNKEAIATVLTFPRFLMPTRIQRMISPPITRHQIHGWSFRSSSASK